MADINIPQQEAQAAKEGYVRRLPVDADIAIDEALGGPMDETISSRMRRWSLMPSGIRQKIGKAICWGLDKFQKYHGEKAQAGDIERAKNVIAIEEKSLGGPKQ